MTRSRVTVVFANNPSEPCFDTAACPECDAYVFLNHATMRARCPALRSVPWTWITRFNPRTGTWNRGRGSRGGLAPATVVAASNACTRKLARLRHSPCRRGLKDDAGVLAERVPGASFVLNETRLRRAARVRSAFSLSTGAMALLHLCSTAPAGRGVLAVGFTLHRRPSHRGVHDYVGEWRAVGRACGDRLTERRPKLWGSPPSSPASPMPSLPASHSLPATPTSSAAEKRQRRLDACPPRGANVTLPPIRAELGFEVEVALPHAWWLHTACGAAVHASSCGDMAALWWFARYTPLPCLRTFRQNSRVCSRAFGWVGKSCHLGRSRAPGLPPAYAAGLRLAVRDACPPRSASRSGEGEAPTLFVLNKFAVEWGGPPVNHIDPRALSPFLNATRLLYHRPDRWAPEKNRPRALAWPGEDAWLRRHGIRDIADAAIGRGETWTLPRQLCHMAQADVFLSSQGGGSRIAALLQRPTVVYHRRGSDNYTNVRRFSPRTPLRVVGSSDALRGAANAELRRLRP